MVHTEMEPAIPWVATHTRGHHKRQPVLKALLQYRAEVPTPLRLGRGKTSQPQAISHTAQECRASRSLCLGFRIRVFSSLSAVPHLMRLNGPPQAQTTFPFNKPVYLSQPRVNGITRLPAERSQPSHNILLGWCSR